MADVQVDNNEHPLTNADFRKFLSTPRPGESDSSKDADTTKRGFKAPRDYNESRASNAEQRRKKKSLYAKIHKQEMERQAELAKKYRDRSKERREGKGDYAETETVNTTADYRAVGPNAYAIRNSAEQRRKAIQESKFLGGDMAHTHLVKGLDYALLQKVRAEISTKEKDDEVLDSLLENADSQIKQNKKKENVLDNIRNKSARNIYKAVFHNKPPPVNEEFLPGRMAYVFDLEEDIEKPDIPTILMRSKVDCPDIKVNTTNSSNDIVMNKLIKIFALIRQENKEKKRRKEKKYKSDIARVSKPVVRGSYDNIFDDVGEYKPSTKKSKMSKLGVGPYFEKKPKADEYSAEKVKDSAAASVKQMIKGVSERSKQEKKVMKSQKSKGNPLLGISDQATDSYMECFPSNQFHIGNAGEDSDEEADYLKMDQGNKKGPLGRWDFENNEEYSKYKSKQEATPKAAFQFGVKMAGGRKTRRTLEQSQKQKIDKELKQIEKIMERRNTEKNSFKKPRY